MNISESEQLLREYEHFICENNTIPIAIYGIGVNTKYILENSYADNLVGLMDAENEGKVIYGYPVLSTEEALHKVKAVIIVARRSAIRIIYNRIKYFEDKGIKIYNLLGMELNSRNLISEEIRTNKYWIKNKQHLFHEIYSHDVISFDIFDTLIGRKVLKPQDIFKIVEENLLKNGLSISFAESRKEAEKIAYGNQEAPKLIDIYNILEKLLNLSTDEIKSIYQLEFETELKYIYPRYTMVEALEYAVKKNKKVYLISDMYLSSKQIEIMLSKCGIKKYGNLIISCEKGKTKETGRLYAEYKTTIGNKRALHIGDNKLVDGEKAKLYDIDTFEIKNGYDLLLESAFADLLTSITNLQESKILGKFIADVLNDPFCLNENKGKLEIKNLYELGYNIFAPVMTLFLSLLIGYLKNNKNLQIIFCARDGFLIKELYELVIDRLGLEDMPKGIYFLTSRRAISVASIKSWKDIEDIIKRTNINASLGQILQIKFGVESNFEDKEAKKNVSSTADKAEIINFIKKYESKILERAKEERKNYEHYIKGLHIENIEWLIFDFVTTGTTVYYIDKMTENGKNLICFSTSNMPNAYTKHLKNIVTLFGNSYSNKSKWNFINYYLLGECILTSPNSQLLYFKLKGEPVYSGEKRNFSEIKEVQAGIRQYIIDYINVNGELPNSNEGLVMADNIIGLINSKYSVVNQEIKKAFISENKYENIYEQNIWDIII